MQSRSTTRSSCAVAARIFAQGTAAPARNETPRTDVRPARRPASGLGAGKTSNAMIRFSKVEIVCAPPSLPRLPSRCGPFAPLLIAAECASPAPAARAAPLPDCGKEAKMPHGASEVGSGSVRRPHPDRRLPAVIPPAGPRDPFRARGPWRRAEPGPGTVR